GAAGAFVVHRDDAHWNDPQSERLLAELADVASTTRVLLLLNFRPEFHAAWMGRSYYQQLSVAPLGREATREMISDLLGHDPSVVELRELIRERTQGNPFFIEEVVHALAASGALAGERGAYRRTSSAAGSPMDRNSSSSASRCTPRWHEPSKRCLPSGSGSVPPSSRITGSRRGDPARPGAGDAWPRSV